MDFRRRIVILGLLVLWAVYNTIEAVGKRPSPRRDGGIYDKAGFRKAQLAYGHFPSASEVTYFSTDSM